MLVVGVVDRERCKGWEHLRLKTSGTTSEGSLVGVCENNLNKILNSILKEFEKLWNRYGDSVIIVMSGWMCSIKASVLKLQY